MKSYSLFLHFDHEQWRKFRKDTPLTLTEHELAKLRGQLEVVSLEEVAEIYLPLSRLLNLYVAAKQELYRVSTCFLGHPEPKVPFIIGIAGSVAVGKSTTSRILQALLSKWPNHPRVDLITTDGYLFPNRILTERELMGRKGFPESYDLSSLLAFLADLKAGTPQLKVPIYSHHYYDVLPHQYQTVDQPDIVIVEGLNVLQIGPAKTNGDQQVYVSDFFDFSIYVDAPTHIIKKWYLQRFMLFRQQAKMTPDAYIYRYVSMSDEQALEQATMVWHSINETNLRQNVLPFKQRADLILEKGEDHGVQGVNLRKL